MRDFPVVIGVGLIRIGARQYEVVLYLRATDAVAFTCETIVIIAAEHGLRATFALRGTANENTTMTPLERLFLRSHVESGLTGERTARKFLYALLAHQALEMRGNKRIPQCV